MEGLILVIVYKTLYCRPFWCNNRSLISFDIKLHRWADVVVRVFTLKYIIDVVGIRAEYYNPYDKDRSI